MNDERRISQLIGQGAQAAATAAQTNAIETMARAIFGMGMEHGKAKAEVAGLRDLLAKAKATEAELRNQLGELEEEEAAIDDTDVQRAEDKAAAQVIGKLMGTCGVDD